MYTTDIFRDRLETALTLKYHRKLYVFCREVGITHTTLNAYRCGKANPPLPVFVRMALVLNVSLEWLSGVKRGGRKNGIQPQ